MTAPKLLRQRVFVSQRVAPRRLAWVAPLVTGALILTGCGKADNAADVDPTASGAPTSTSYYSPLDEYLNPQAGQDFNEEDWRAKDRQVQELVATCMKDQGFDYIPQDSSAASYSVGGDEGLSERDAIAKYGYWVSTQLELQAQATQAQQDPNQAAYDGMSDSERMAYDAALWGSGVMMGTSSAAAGAEPAASTSASVASTDVASTDAASTDAASTNAVSTDAVSTDADVSDEPADGAPVSIAEGGPVSESYVIPTTPEELGCYGVAQQDIYGDQMYGNAGVADDFQDLFDAQSELYMSIDKDPRLAEAVTAWSTCLEGKGYPGFTEMQAPMIEVNKRFAELNGQTFTVNEDGSWMTEPKEGTEGDEPVVPDPTKLAELKSYEIDLALADYDCKGDYAKIQDEVRISLEEQFVQDHKAELERYRDAINTGGN